MLDKLFSHNLNPHLRKYLDIYIQNLNNKAYLKEKDNLRLVILIV